MSGFFSMDNPVWNFLGKMWDVIWLTLLWFVCSIPIFTIGASTTAFYYVGLKIVGDEEGYITKQFFHSFKQNFKQSTVIWLIMLVVGFVLGFNVKFYLSLNNKVSTVLMILILFMLWVYLMMLQYVFAVLSKFDNTIRNIFKFSFLIAIKKIGWTMLMIGILVGVIAAGLFLFTPILFFSPGIVIICDCLILRRIFKPLIEEAMAAGNAKAEEASQEGTEENV